MLHPLMWGEKWLQEKFMVFLSVYLLLECFTWQNNPQHNSVKDNSDMYIWYI